VNRMRLDASGSEVWLDKNGADSKVTSISDKAKRAGTVGRHKDGSGCKFMNQGVESLQMVQRPIEGGILLNELE
jgi:hypothetical protein